MYCRSNSCPHEPSGLLALARFGDTWAVDGVRGDAETRRRGMQHIEPRRSQATAKRKLGNRTAYMRRPPSRGLPGCHTQGETLEEVRANLREAAEGGLAVAH